MIVGYGIYSNEAFQRISNLIQWSDYALTNMEIAYNLKQVVYAHLPFKPDDAPVLNDQEGLVDQEEKIKSEDNQALQNPPRLPSLRLENIRDSSHPILQTLDVSALLSQSNPKIAKSDRSKKIKKNNK